MNTSATGTRAWELYNTRIRDQVEAENKGRYIVIDVVSGDYEIGDDYLVPIENMHRRYLDAQLYTMRIGYPALGRIGRRVGPARE